MRLLILTMVIVIGSLSNAQAFTNLDSSKTTTPVFDYPNRYKEACRLESRVQGTDGNPYSLGRRTGRSIYDGLTRTGTTGTKTTQTIVPPTPIIIDSDDYTPVDDSTGWIPTAAIKDCECGARCKCPPLVCDVKACRNSYAVVFASKSCIPCRKMWDDIKELRKDGYTVFYVVIEDHPEVKHQFNVRRVPTTIVMDNGAVKARFNGVTTAAKLKSHLKRKDDATTRQPRPIR